MGANPTAWFVFFALILTFVRFWLENRKEAKMKRTEYRRKAQVKSGFNVMKNVTVAFVETSWAIFTSFAAGFVTLSIYVKGAPHLS